MADITDGFDPGDDDRVLEVLKKWQGGRISNNLFAKLAEMTPQSGVVVVVFREANNGTEVLLLPRPKTDPVWPGMLNLPGKIFRSSDFKHQDKTPVESILARIEGDELKTKFIDKPEFVGPVYQDTKRGYVVVLLHMAKVKEISPTPSDWVWTNIKDLENLENYVKTEQSSIDLALKKYLENKK